MFCFGLKTPQVLKLLQPLFRCHLTMKQHFVNITQMHVFVKTVEPHVEKSNFLALLCSGILTQSLKVQAQ